VSPRTSARGGDGSKQSQHSTSPVHSSPLQKELPQSQSQSTPNLNPPPGGSDSDGKGNTAVPGILGGRSTAESQPVRAPSKGFQEGGDRGITIIREEVENAREAG